MIRKVIKIDEEKCNGCGLCADAWNQGIGYFSSEIGPSTLFMAYKTIKKMEKQGKEPSEICEMLKENFGEKNPHVKV